MVVARTARAFIYFLLVYFLWSLISLVRLSLWVVYLFGSIISLVSPSGCCSVRRRAGNAGLSLYGLMSRECFLSFL
jgi:hypothetical protein